MPNHIHILVQQTDERIISDFMRSVHVSYTKYFNNKYKRVGTLFQSKYKARLLYTFKDKLYISKYIHRNPIDIGVNPKNYKWSSLKYYDRKYSNTWINNKPITNIFINSGFIEKYKSYLDYVLDPN